ncbi:MAG: hypothetical protein AAB887_01080, partial [Patescibacteria group bacterium]
KTFLWCPALTEQAAGLCGFRSDGSAFLPPTPSCRAALASAKSFFGGLIKSVVFPLWMMYHRK